MTTTEKDIDELTRLRRQTAWWRWGAMIFNLVWVIGCLLAMNNAVRGLFVAGPRQEQFTHALGSNIQRDIVPNVQALASRTLAEARPEVEASFKRLNQRVPEISQAAYNEVQQIQASLPEKGEKLLSDTYGQMLTQKEQKIRTMFPDATEENVRGLTKTLSDMGQQRAVAVNDRLFKPHQTALNNIITNMEQIRLAENGKPGQAVTPDWEMTLAIMDIIRDELHDMERMTAQQNGTAKASASGAKTGAKAKSQNNGKGQ